MTFLRQVFIVLCIIVMVVGIIKITIAAMLLGWSADFAGFMYVTYKPEISGATLSGVFDLAFSLFGLSAISRNDARLLYVFTLNMILTSLAKVAQVYLCAIHLRQFPFILKYEVDLIWLRYNYREEAINITDRVQSQFSCCGAFDITSWKRKGMDLLPRSCCHKVARCSVEFASKKGCYQALLETVKFGWMQFLLTICIPFFEVLHLIVGCSYSINYL